MIVLTLMLINRIKMSKKEQLIKELFIGKVSEIIGFKKTLRLLQEATEAVNSIKIKDDVGQREQLVAFGIWLDKNDKHLENGNITETVEEYLRCDRCMNWQETLDQEYSDYKRQLIIKQILSGKKLK